VLSRSPKDDLPSLSAPNDDLSGLSAPNDDLPGLSPPKDNLPGLSDPSDDLPGLSAPKDDLPGLSDPNDDLPGLSAPKDDLPGLSAPSDARLGRRERLAFSCSNHDAIRSLSSNDALSSRVWYPSLWERKNRRGFWYLSMRIGSTTLMDRINFTGVSELSAIGWWRAKLLRRFPIILIIYIIVC
jgi:hypothetical protein